MQQLLGEYDCKIDAKGRMRLPVLLVKQLVEGESQSFVVNRGVEKRLILYPKNVWDLISQRVNKLNTYVKKNRDFMRYFYRGATEVNIDGNERVLLTKRLLEYAGIQKDVILFAINDRVEIWAKEKYDNLIDEEPENFSDLAEDVMGGQVPVNDDE